MADFGKITARVHRKTGVGRDFTVTLPSSGAVVTHADCKSVGTLSFQLVEGGARWTDQSGEVIVPRVSGAVRPPAGGEHFGSFDGGPPFTIQSSAETAGFWRVRG